MKKALNIVLCFGLFIQNFLFAVPVFAAETENVQQEETDSVLKQEGIDIAVEAVRQGDTLLTEENGIYEIPNTNAGIYVNYQVHGLDASKQYKFRFINSGRTENSSYDVITGTESRNATGYVYLSSKEDITNSTIQVVLIHDDGSEAIVASKDLKFHLEGANNPLIGKSKLYISKIVQNGENLTPLKSPYYMVDFAVHSSQDVEVFAKGEGFVDDFSYQLYSTNHAFAETVSGRTLNEGIREVIPASSIKFDERHRMYVYFRVNSPVFNENYSATFYLNDSNYSVGLTDINQFHKEEELVYSVQENGQKIEATNGVYQITDVNSNLNVIYAISGLNSASKYKFQWDTTIPNYSYASKEFTNQESFSESTSVTLDGLSADTTLTANLYKIEADGSETLISSKPFSFHFADLEKLHLTEHRLELQKVSQDGVEILPEILDNYTINDANAVQYKIDSTKDVEVFLKGENYIDDFTYYLSAFNPFTFTGREINQGVHIIIPRDSFHFENSFDHRFSFSINTRLTTFHHFMNAIASIKGIDRGVVFADYKYFAYKESVFYTDFKDVKVEDNGILDSRYFNQNHSLSLNIRGERYEDREYPISIQAVREYYVGEEKHEEVLYTKEEAVLGTLLNQGYNLELDGFVLPVSEDLDGNFYLIKITIDDVTHQFDFSYGENVHFYSEIFYQNGLKISNIGGGYGSPMSGGQEFFVNRAFLEENPLVSLFNRLEGADPEEDYQYTLEGGEVVQSEDYIKPTLVPLQTGTLTGAEMEKGFLLEVTPLTYQYPIYCLKIQKGNQLIYQNDTAFTFTDKPTLANVQLTSNDKNLYVKSDDLWSYVALRGLDFQASLAGVGFEEDKTYDIYAYEHNYRLGDERKSYVLLEKVSASGKDINHGDVILDISRISKNLDNSNLEFYVTEKDVSFSPFYDSANWNEWKETFISNGYIYIKYVDSKDYFPEDIPYVVEEENAVIQGVETKMTVDHFTSTLNISDSNNYVKVFDRDGKTEQTHFVGTGMITRVFGTNDEPLFDMEVVVKGDVSGDGDISSTDLIQVKQHLADISNLSGVYEKAGDVTGTGQISITDLVKLSQAVAGTEEAQS